MEFHDRTVLITGAAGNLGRAVADVFYAQGANLVLLGQHADHLREAFGAEDARRRFAAVNLLDADAVARAADAARARFGRVDVLCNLAGGFRMGSPVHATADADLDFLFDVNVRTMMHAVRAIAPGMIAAGGGKIVNVGAHAAGKGAAQMGAYCAAKSALIRLTEAMAAELREAGVNVNCVLPTIIDTPENRAAMPGADPARWVAPAALADVIAFLASDAARAIHGAAVPVTDLS